MRMRQLVRVQQKQLRQPRGHLTVQPLAALTPLPEDRTMDIDDAVDWHMIARKWETRCRAAEADNARLSRALIEQQESHDKREGTLLYDNAQLRAALKEILRMRTEPMPQALASAQVIAMRVLEQCAPATEKWPGSIPGGRLPPEQKAGEE